MNLERFLREIGEFLHSDPASFTNYAEAKKEALEAYYALHDALMQKDQ